MRARIGPNFGLAILTVRAALGIFPKNSQISNLEVEILLFQNSYCQTFFGMPRIRNVSLKNHKVHYVKIIVWRRIFERNDVKCHIEHLKT